MVFSQGCFQLFLFVCILQPFQAASSQTSSQNNYTVTSNDVTCVVMTAALQLTIPYMSTNGNSTSNITIPPDVISSGLCQPNLGQDTLSLFFNNGWQMSITFGNASGPAYQWQKISFTYKMDSQHFPNISTALADRSVTQDTVFPAGTMVTARGASYSCSNTLLDLKGGVTLNVTGLRYRALGTDSFNWFNATNVVTCSSHDVIPETDVALAISLGIALGAAIVGVVILYVIASRIMDRKRGRSFG